MKVSRLRALMRRYGAIGVIGVGLYLLLHHLWTRHRAPLIVFACLIGLGVVSGFSRRESPPPAVPIVTVPGPPPVSVQEAIEPSPESPPALPPSLGDAA